MKSNNEAAPAINALRAKIDEQIATFQLSQSEQPDDEKGITEGSLQHTAENNGLKDLSITDLQEEMDRRQAAIDRLMAQRAQLDEQVTAIQNGGVPRERSGVRGTTASGTFYVDRHGAHTAKSKQDPNLTEHQRKNKVQQSLRMSVMREVFTKRKLRSNDQLRAELTGTLSKKFGLSRKATVLAILEFAERK